MYNIIHLFFDQKYDYFWDKIRIGETYDEQKYRRWLNGLIELCSIVQDYALFRNNFVNFYSPFTEDDVKQKFNKVKKDIIKLLNDEIDTYEGMVNLFNSLNNFKYAVNDVK